MADLDHSMEAYFDALYFDGALPFEGRQVLYGTAYVRNFATKPPEVLHSAKAALKGWEKLVPMGERDPAPWEAWLLVADKMLETKSDLGLLSAAAGSLQYDGYFRPSEVLSIMVRDVVQPARNV